MRSSVQNWLFVPKLLLGLGASHQQGCLDTDLAREDPAESSTGLNPYV